MKRVRILLNCVDPEAKDGSQRGGRKKKEAHKNLSYVLNYCGGGLFANLSIRKVKLRKRGTAEKENDTAASLFSDHRKGGKVFRISLPIAAGVRNVRRGGWEGRVGVSTP